MLGDCYLLSAMAVLGNKGTRERFVYIETDDEWEACGAFCVVFYNDGKEEIIIVDDYVPFSKGSDDFLFV
jgi:hypothetical protein